MGLFDYFSKDAANARTRERALKKLTNMYYQQADRMAAAESVFHLAEQGDQEAVKVLLKRFEHLCPSTTVDREEKDYVVELLVGLGDTGVETIIAYCKKTSKAIYWPLKVLEKLWSKDLYAEFIAEVLEGTDNGYWRDPEKKIGLAQLAAKLDDPRVQDAMVPFVEDHTEEVRLAAFETLFAAGDAYREPLLNRLVEEESRRSKKLLASGFAERGWSVAEHAEHLAGTLPQGFRVNGGKIVAA